MTSQAFERGYIILATAFQGLKFDAGLLWETWNDLDGQIFLTTVMEIVKTTRELYPGSNIIAIVREKAEEVATEQKRRTTLAIEKDTEKERMDRLRAEAVPMPQECREALAKIGITLPEPKA